MTAAMIRKVLKRKDRAGSMEYLSDLLTGNAAFMRGWIAQAEGGSVDSCGNRIEKIGYIVAREIEMTGALPSFDEVDWEITYGTSIGSA